MQIDHTYMSARPSKEIVHSIQLGRQTMLQLKCGQENSLVFVIHVAMVNETTVNPQIGLTVGIVYHYPLVDK